MNKMIANRNYDYKGHKGPYTPGRHGEPSVEDLLGAIRVLENIGQLGEAHGEPEGAHVAA